MPIRMEEDPQDHNNDDNNNNNPRRNTNRSGGGGLLTSLLPLLLSVLFKKPKLLLLVAVIGGAIYFLGGGLFSNSGGGGGGGGGGFEDLFKGASLSEEQYDKAMVFEALANNAKNPLPESISLEQYCPDRLNQGRQGSCVGWASSYAARTILHSRQTNRNPNQVRFSPSYLYNQIALEGCQGAYLRDAMENMRQGGVLPFSEFGYDEATCRKAPNSSEKQEATQYRTKGYNRLSKGGNNYKSDLLAIKQNLAQGAPVVIGMMVGGTFMRNMEGKKSWRPSSADYDKRGFGGHAMCVIGYDDYLNGGSFQIMNSWGENWGENGIAWVSYKDFDFFVKEAYGLYPMGKGGEQQADRFAAAFGLQDVKSGFNIPLTQKSGNVFTTKAPIRKGDKFKVEFTNTIECYTYVFGQETDGSSYILFPYTKKHSPYCGITGTRLFPKDFSMKADEIGNKDYIAVVVSKEPLDYNVVNERISKASGSNYAAKLNSVLGGDAVQGVKFGSKKDMIVFETPTKGKNVVGMVIEIDKQ